MENNLENLTIGVFAKAAGVNVETIRFYQRKGLLREPDKQPLPAPPVHGLLPGCLAPKKEYILYLYDDHRIYRWGV
jgi:MerR family mercuric resistance operon transcriptional regulator